MTFLSDFKTGIDIQDFVGSRPYLNNREFALHGFCGKIDTNVCIRAEDVETPMCLNPGDILRDRYRIERKLGKGGFGVTYLARDLETRDRRIVVKEIPQQSDDLPVLNRARLLFEREVEALKKLGQHPQIPELFDSFEEQHHFYLIQEYIEGHPLKNELIPDRPWSKPQTLALLQDILEVLEFVHQNGVVHRDIHPGNLIRRSTDGKIVLIDFGAVKEIGTLERNESREITTHAIGTPGYMPPEQTRGLTQPSSDIYAVGCICVQALTGLHPSQFQTQFQRDGAANLILRDLPVCSKSIELLERMVRYHFNDRYPSATEALEAVRRLETSWWCEIGLRWVVRLALVVVCGAIAFSGLRFFAPPTCGKRQGDDLSCGEEILGADEIDNTAENKKMGVEEFAAENYDRAIEYFKTAREQRRNDPETLIYLNNADLAAREVRVYTIAVIVPLKSPDSSEHEDVNISPRQKEGLEILRGIAQAQAEINQRNQSDDVGWGLRVLVADDRNDLEYANTIAEALGERAEILAIVGHSTSSLVKETLDIYEQHQLVSISPSSTSDELNDGDDLSPFLFRTSAEEAANTEKLVEHLLEMEISQVAIFYNDRSSATASQALRNEFSQHFGKARIVAEFDLSQSDFNADAAIEEAAQQGATGLLLFPDAKVDPVAFNNTLAVLEVNRNRYWAGGGTSIYTSDLLELGELANGVVVTVPWHHLTSPNPDFASNAKALWGGSVSWRTAMAYDATLVLAEAIEAQANPNPIEVLWTSLNPKHRRIRLQQTLTDRDFSRTGATGIIQFDETGDRLNPSVELVRVLPCPNLPSGFAFVPIEFETATDAGLACEKMQN